MDSFIADSPQAAPALDAQTYPAATRTGGTRHRERWSGVSRRERSLLE
jgi:hypothetical protein